MSTRRRWGAAVVMVLVMFLWMGVGQTLGWVDGTFWTNPRLWNLIGGLLSVAGVVLVWRSRPDEPER